MKRLSRTPCPFHIAVARGNGAHQPGHGEGGRGQNPARADLRHRLQRLLSPPAQTVDKVKLDLVIWGKVAKDANIKAE